MKIHAVTYRWVLLTLLAACSGTSGEPGGSPDAGSDGAACTPRSCVQGACGSWSNGCGGTLQCGGCGAEACGVAMTPGWCGNCAGDSWCSESPAPAGAYGFSFVTAVSDSSVWVTDPSGLIMEWDGATWHDRSIRTKGSGALEKGPEALWGASPTDVWGISWRGLWHWNGTSWSLTAKSGWWPVAISGTSSSNIWVVGQSGLIARFDGSSWTKVVSPTSSNLLAVSARTPSDAWAVGQGAKILHWDGTRWTQVSPSTSTTDWRDVKATAEGEAWLVSTNGAVYRWTGQFESRWEVTGTPIHRIWAFSPTNVWGVGGSGLAVHWTSTQGVPVATGTSTRFDGIAGTPDGDLWVVGPSQQSSVFRHAAR